MKKYFALTVGAFVGTILRYQMGEWVTSLPNGFPLGTMAINLVGCLFLGWFLTIDRIRWKLPLEVRLGIGTGLTGSFTTFSTFSLETIQLLKNHHIVMAFIYVVVSVLGGVVLAAIGQSLAKFQMRGLRRGEKS